MFDTSDFDLDAYFHRLELGEERTDTPETLARILQGHVRAIPFENLNPLVGWPVLLDAASLQRKLVHEARGGYCYEQNLLLGHALTRLGFSVTGLAARVLWNAPPNAVTPRSHMLLLVDLGGRPHLADVGFGGLTLTGLLRLEAGIEQATPHETFRLVEDAGGFVMEARLGGAWRPLYRFDLQPQLLPDYEVANWFVSTHPRSHFVNGLMAARAVPGRRYGLRNRELTVQDVDGLRERRVLQTAAEARAVLTETFGIRVPDDPAVDAALTRVMAAA